MYKIGDKFKNPNNAVFTIVGKLTDNVWYLKQGHAPMLFSKSTLDNFITQGYWTKLKPKLLVLKRRAQALL